MEMSEKVTKHKSAGKPVRDVPWCKHDMTKLLVYAARHETIKEKNMGQILMPIRYVYKMSV